jgi:hypothetical protein
MAVVLGKSGGCAHSTFRQQKLLSSMEIKLFAA